MTRPAAADRRRRATCLLAVFVACWVGMALLYLIPVAKGAISLRGWMTGMSLAPVLPYVAVLTGDDSVSPVFMVPYVLAPLVLAYVAICRQKDDRWIWFAGAAIVAWWLVLAVLASVGV